jgi:hypothetical protein
MKRDLRLLAVTRWLPHAAATGAGGIGRCVGDAAHGRGGGGPRSVGSPVSWRTWRREPRRTPSGCWPTPHSRCGGAAPQPRSRRSRAPATPRQGVARAGWLVRSTTCPIWSRRPGRWPRRLGNACVGRPRRRHPTGDSLHDPDARPRAKGRLGKPVELGHKAQTVEHDDCVVAHYNVEQATPPTHPIGARGQAVSKRAGRPPRTVTADRGYGEKSIVDDLHDLGVRDVVVPHKGQPSAANNIGRRSDEPFHGAPGA